MDEGSVESATQETVCEDIVSCQSGLQREEFRMLSLKNGPAGQKPCFGENAERSTTTAQDACRRLAIIPATSLGRLFVILPFLDFLGQPFFFAQLLETSEHLFDTLAATGFDSNGHLVKVLAALRHVLGG